MKRSVLAVTAGLLLAVPAKAQDVSFEGKTIKVLINFPSGGSTDILMRSLAPAIEAKIPGKPNIVIENKPGAGGLVAANYFYNLVKPDGLTIGFLTGIGTAGLVGGPQVKFDPTKMRWLAALPQTQVIVARTDLGIKQPADFANSDKPLQHAITSPTSSSTVLNKLFYGMLGVPHKLIAGYRGQADTLLALQRGEVNVADMGITIYLAKLKEMTSAMALSGVLQRGMLKDNGEFARHRLLPVIPTAVDAIRAIKPTALSSTEFKAYKVVIGTFNVQFGFQLPPKTDERIVQTLRMAIIAALASDEAKQAAIKSAGLDYDYIDGAAAEKELARLSDDLKKDPAVRQLLTSLMAGK